MLYAQFHIKFNISLYCFSSALFTAYPSFLPLFHSNGLSFFPFQFLFCFLPHISAFFIITSFCFKYILSYISFNLPLHFYIVFSSITFITALKSFSSSPVHESYLLIYFHSKLVFLISIHSPRLFHFCYLPHFIPVFPSYFILLFSSPFQQNFCEVVTRCAWMVTAILYASEEVGSSAIAVCFKMISDTCTRTAVP